MEFVQGALLFGVAGIVGAVIARSLSLFIIGVLVTGVSVALLWGDHKHHWSDRQW